jgi:hypothetical protein
MGKVWVLDTETKGTGAQMLPLEKVLERPEKPERRSRRRPQAATRQKSESFAAAPERTKPAAEPTRTATPLPPGHVRRRATGELGRVQAVDPRAGTATVLWLRQGRASTVPIDSITRR